MLSQDEFCDNTRLRYGIWPINLCERCDGWEAGFSVDHMLSCKKGGLVCQHHEDTRDEAGSLAANALTTLRISCKPHIFYGRGVSAGIEAEDTSRPGSNVARDKARGDVAVHGLWEKGKIFILDIRITDTDAKTYAGSSSVKVLEKAAKVKKDEYETACIARQ